MSDSVIRTGEYCPLPEGIRLHYAQAGEPGRPVMLMLHGFPEYWEAWRELMPLMAASHHVVAPDLRGFNLSSKPESPQAYQQGMLAGDVIGLMDHLQCAQAVVVAHDWGGAVGWTLAMTHPERISRLVILNSPHPVLFGRELRDNPAQQQASAYMNWLRAPGTEEKLAAKDFAVLRRFLLAEGPQPWLTEAVLQGYRDAWSQPGALRGGCNYYRSTPLYPPLPDDGGERRLTLDGSRFQVSVPTQVIWGERDLALLPSLLDGLDRYVADLRIERVAEAGHWIAHQEPKRVAALIDGFVNPVERS